MPFIKRSNKKEIENLLKKFVVKLSDKNKLDEKLKNDIMKLATTWNKEELMKDLIEKVEVHKSYEEEKGKQFPYKSYIDRFFEEEQGQAIRENTIHYEDVFHKGLQKGRKPSGPLSSNK